MKILRAIGRVMLLIAFFASIVICCADAKKLDNEAKELAKRNTGFVRLQK